MKSVDVSHLDPRDPQDVCRLRLVKLAAVYKGGLKKLSLDVLKENHSYLQQYVKRRSPQVLRIEHQQELESALGAPSGHFSPLAQMRVEGGVLMPSVPSTPVAPAEAIEKLMADLRRALEIDDFDGAIRETRALYHQLHLAKINRGDLESPL